MVLGTAQVRAAPSPVQVELRETLRGRRVALWRANESPNLIAALAFRKGSHYDYGASYNINIREALKMGPQSGLFLLAGEIQSREWPRACDRLCCSAGLVRTATTS